MILFRTATETVRFKQRQVDIVAVPFGEVVETDDGSGRYREAFDPNMILELLRDPVPALLHHDPMQPFGHVQIRGPSRAGVHGTMHAARTVLGDETLELADAGVLHPSIGFTSTAHEMRGRVRWRTAIVLHEISLVTFPAYPGAVVTAVRTQPEPVPLLQQAQSLMNIFRNVRAR